MTSMEKNQRFCNVEALTGQVKTLIENVFGMAGQHCAMHEVERALWQGLLALGRELMQAFYRNLGRNLFSAAPDPNRGSPGGQRWQPNFP